MSTLLAGMSSLQMHTSLKVLLVVFYNPQGTFSKFDAQIGSPGPGGENLVRSRSSSCGPLARL